MTGRRYWLYYCASAGLSKELSKQVVDACEKAGSFSDIDARITRAKLSKELSKSKPAS